MPSIGPMEILVVAVLGLIVFGPEKLPEIARTVGAFFKQVRAMADDVKQEFSDGFDIEDEPDDDDEPDAVADDDDEKAPAAEHGDGASQRKKESPESDGPASGRKADTPTAEDGQSNTRPGDPAERPVAGVIRAESDEPRAGGA